VPLYQCTYVAGHAHMLKLYSLHASSMTLLNPFHSPMKIQLLLPALLLFLTPLLSGAQVTGKVFPSMTAETIDDEEVALPESTKGKYTLIGLAYSKKSES